MGNGKFVALLHCCDFRNTEPIDLPLDEMHMGCHVARHHCSIGWLVHKLIRVHSMGLAVVEVEVVVVVAVDVVAVVVVEHVVLVAVVECMYYVGLLGLQLEHEPGNTLPIPRYIPTCGDKIEKRSERERNTS